MEWLTLLLNFFQPLALKCFEKTSSEDPQQVLRENYDPVTGRMDWELVEDAVPVARRAAVRARRSLPREERKNTPRYTRAQLREVAEEGLIKSMNASPEEVAKCRAVAAQMKDVDDISKRILPPHGATVDRQCVIHRAGVK